VQADDKHANPSVLASAGTAEFKQHYCESFSQTDLTHMQSWRRHPKRQHSPLPFSVLLPGASCVMLAQVSVQLPSAQDVGTDPAGGKKPHVSFGGFYPEAAPTIPKPK